MAAFSSKDPGARDAPTTENIAQRRADRRGEQAHAGSGVGIATDVSQATAAVSRRSGYPAALSRRRVSVGMIALLAVLAAQVAVILFPGLVSSADPNVVNPQMAYATPTAQHPLGTDSYGRDILARLIAGTKLSFERAGGAFVVAMTLGVVCGLTAGYYGKFVDFVFVWFVDLALSVPGIVLGILLIALVGTGDTVVAIAIGLTIWPGILRIVRSATLVETHKEYVEAARSMGATIRRQIFSHILPNILPKIVGLSGVWLGAALKIEIGLAFLGVGIQPPASTLGSLLKDGYGAMLVDPREVLFALGVICLNVILLTRLSNEWV